MSPLTTFFIGLLAALIIAVFIAITVRNVRTARDRTVGDPRSRARSSPTFALSSTAFTSSEEMPPQYTCDADDASPPLAWTDPPERTRALALVLEDPDAPGGPFTHWLLADIPASTRALPEGLRANGVGVAGTNDFGRRGYGGPCPPDGHGVHHYHFYLHALSAPLMLEPGFDRATLEAALRDRVIATTELTGLYARSRDERARRMA